MLHFLFLLELISKEYEVTCLHEQPLVSEFYQDLCFEKVHVGAFHCHLNFSYFDHCSFSFFTLNVFDDLIYDVYFTNFLVFFQIPYLCYFLFFCLFIFYLNQNVFFYPLISIYYHSLLFLFLSFFLSLFYCLYYHFLFLF